MSKLNLGNSTYTVSRKETCIKFGDKSEQRAVATC